MPRILNAGSLNIDHVYRVARIARPGETISSSSYARFAGGKGFNQSVALARAGATAAHAGCIGADGRWLRELLAQERVDVTRVNEVGQPTGHALIQVSSDGENAIVLFPGANFAPTAEGAVRWLDGFQPGDWLLCQNEITCVPDLLAAARQRGLIVCFNPAPMTSAVRSWPLSHVDWLVVNETEGAELAGAVAPEQIIATLREKLPGTSIVLSLGAAGLICQHAGELIRVAAPRVTAVDTTAAGDTLIGYMVAALAAGMSAPDALQRACRAAAICVTRAGAAVSVPKASEVDDPGKEPTCR